MRFTTLVVAVGTLLGGVATPALASVGISISSSGIHQIDTYTDTDTIDSAINFSIVDPLHRASQVSQCLVDANDEPYDCDTYPLRDTYFGDGSWRIRETGTGWQIRYFVGYYAVTEDECLQQALRRVHEGVNIAILGDFENVLAETTHTWNLTCQGFAASTSGSHTVKSAVGRTSSPLRIGVSLIDGRHVISKLRTCLHDMRTDAYFNCGTRPVTDVAKRTTQGWTYSTSITTKPMTSSQCAKLRRNPGQYEYTAAFSDRSGDVVVSAAHDFSLTCR